jgi:hypothetical protein
MLVPGITTDHRSDLIGCKNRVGKIKMPRMCVYVCARGRMCVCANYTDEHSLNKEEIHKHIYISVFQRDYNILIF